MKKKFLGLLFAATLCMACAACGGDTQTDVTPTPEATEAPQATATPEPTEAAPVVDEGASNTMTEDKISITVSTNKASYEAYPFKYTQILNRLFLYKLYIFQQIFKNTCNRIQFIFIRYNFIHALCIFCF